MRGNGHPRNAGNRDFFDGLELRKAVTQVIADPRCQAPARVPDSGTVLVEDASTCRATALFMLATHAFFIDDVVKTPTTPEWFSCG